ncbi:mercury(II) reductase [Oceanicella actignis]|uniref:mercury(II) reductase n=1 Tax=Oceanicella actignis TaxID=1189325 RepID=UPI0011E740A1|nr:mercury(II) reductase [Oceanicella actignis]TYO91371.1 mercuric reductase [Oceanicella actignis]
MSADCCARGDDAFDLAVIGAGSAGFSAAIAAAEAGRRVALFGHGTIGGTCVNVGCVPSKAMIRAAAAVRGAADAGRFPGVTPCKAVADWAGLVEGTARLVDEMRRRKYADLLPRHPGIAYFELGPAWPCAQGVEAGGRVFRAPRVILATGSRPRMPDIEGLAEVGALDSTGLLTLRDKPRSLIVLGGGYVGVELAQMAARLGVETTLLARSRLLPGAEPEIAAALTDALRAEGLRVETGLTYLRASRGPEGVTLTCARDGARLELSAGRLVVAAGRVPNVEGLGLAELGVETDARGAIRVGPDMATTRPGVYAAGDVTDREPFVYMAAHGGKVAASNALGLAALRYDDSAVPWVVFSDPQVAGVGLTEAEARAAGREARVSVLSLEHVPRAAVGRDARGAIKLVADAADGRLLGGQIAAPEAGEVIQTLAMAIRAGMTARELGDAIFPYLTMAEGLKLAAQTFERDVASLSCCAG